MKNIQAQYQDLLEGRMTKANFMRNVRMGFPQFVSPTTSYDDSVKILKGKRILSEDLKAVKEPNPNAGKYRIMSIDGKQVIAKDFFDSMEAAQEYAKKNIRTSHKIVKLPAERSVYRKINEDKKPIGVYGHNPNAENDLYRGIDHVNYYQAYKGIQFELAKEKEITDEVYVKVREKVVKNILKNPDAYKDLQLANFKAVKEMDEDLEMKEVKADNHVDKANEMKVVKKDAPASANEVKKDNKKKEKIAQMTQAPKSQKGVEAFPTPGKEKIMALKEHILEDLTTGNNSYEDIGKGSRVKKKDLTSYDANSVGNVEDFDGHTALVKWDSGEVEHVQKNVLTKKDIPQHPKAAEKFGSLSNMGSVQGPDTGVSPKLTQMQDTVKEGGDSDLDSIAQAEFGMDYDQLGPGEQEWCRDERDNKVEESKDVEQSDMKSKLKKIKERLIKALKKEGSVIATQGGETIGSNRNSASALTQARDLERKTGDQLQVIDTRSGVKRQV